MHFFYWVLRPVKIISLIVRWVYCKVGQKWEIPEKNHLTTRKQNMWQELGSRTQQWHVAQFKVIKISIFNHLAMGGCLHMQYTTVRFIQKMQTEWQTV